MPGDALHSKTYISLFTKQWSTPTNDAPEILAVALTTFSSSFDKV